MAAAGSVRHWVRGQRARIRNNLADVAGVARHEGVATAGLVLAYRVLRFAKAKLARLRSAAQEMPRPGQVSLPARQMQAALPLKPGVLFVGYVEASLGLGESLRGLVNSAAQAGVPFAIEPYNVNVETRVTGPFREADYDRENAYAVSVIEMAVDQLPTVFETLGPRLNSGGYTILRTYWELPQAPLAWAPLLEPIDEIWAPNEFVAGSFRHIFDGPITIIPPCVDVVPQAVPPRDAFGLAPGRFHFLFTFDYFSFPARKNPIGVVRAFRAAFPRGDEPVALVIKSTGSQDQYPEIRAIIAKAASLDPRITVMDGTLTREEIEALIAGCDAYVSLHRSEGFGLGMVEAMSFGRPVIGTDFSGSTDFLSARTGYPVPFTPRPVRRGEYVYSEGQFWAEPDMEAAAKAMRAVFEDRAEASRRAEAGRAFVLDRYSRESVGAKVAARLAEIEAGAARHG